MHKPFRIPSAFCILPVPPAGNGHVTVKFLSRRFQKASLHVHIVGGTTDAFPEKPFQGLEPKNTLPGAQQMVIEDNLLYSFGQSEGISPGGFPVCLRKDRKVK